jgi:hypothetical protein
MKNKLNTATKKAIKTALIEIADEKKLYFDAYNYWWKQIIGFVECPVISLKEYLKRESEYDFGIRIASYYALKYRELETQEKNISALLEKK